ncbi:acyltransferase family protein [Saprospiraceae bacterium]|nr:acyltransferase family protein [Saprospiraceae bacterium]
MNVRLDWVDQARGLAIFMVVWGHNFPSVEPYIYSFHVPLFFVIAGMFHPKKITKSTVIKRAKSILIPYFFWASALFVFWFVVGRKFGESSEISLDPKQNFIGIFYSQGGQEFMDWGIPLWFLPCIFLVFLLFSALQLIKNKVLFYLSTLLVVACGFMWFPITGIHLPWSIDVAMVAISFYVVGNIFRNQIVEIKKQHQYIALVLFLILHVAAFYFNTEKIDMYRSIYGQPWLFYISGLFGALFYMLLLKTIPILKFLSYLGKHTIVILATHTRALTVIKLMFLLVFGTSFFEFNELEKILLAVAQIVLLIPLIIIVNKYLPILDGKIKKTI